MAVALFIPIERINDEARTVEGWACSEELAHDGMIIDHEAAVRAFDDWFTNRGNMREMHDPKKAVGRAVAWSPDPQQRRIWISARVSKGADDTWEKIKDGTLRGFSLKGDITKQEPRVLTRADGVRQAVPWVTELSIYELSFVDVPSDPAASIQVIRADGSATDVLDDTALATPIFVTAERVNSIHPPIVGVHTHEHAGYDTNASDPQMPHTHVHEHGADGTADANHGHSHANVHAVIKREADTMGLTETEDTPQATVPAEQMSQELLRGNVAIPTPPASGISFTPDETHDNTGTASNDRKKKVKNKGHNLDTEASGVPAIGETVDADKTVASARGGALHAPTVTDNKLDITDAGGRVARASYTPEPYHADADETVKCPDCGKMNDTDARFCDQCGAKLTGETVARAADSGSDAEDENDEAKVCVKCGAKNDSSDTTCAKCGAKLGKVVRGLTPEQQAEQQRIAHMASLLGAEGVDRNITQASTMLDELYAMKRSLQHGEITQDQVVRARDAVGALHDLIASAGDEEDGTKYLTDAVQAAHAFLSGDIETVAAERRHEEEMEKSFMEGITRALGDITAELKTLKSQNVTTPDSHATSVATEGAEAPAATVPAEVQRNAPESDAAKIARLETEMATMRQTLERVASQPAQSGPVRASESVAADKLFPGSSPETSADLERAMSQPGVAANNPSVIERTRLQSIVDSVRGVRTETHQRMLTGE